MCSQVFTKGAISAPAGAASFEFLNRVACDQTTNEDGQEFCFPGAATILCGSRMPSTFYKSRACRQLAMLLPARIDDYVASDNPARDRGVCPLA